MLTGKEVHKIMDRNEFEDILKKCRCNHGDENLICEMTKIVAASGNPYFICDFAEYVKAADTPENMKILEDAIIATNDVVHIYEFAFCMVDSQINNFNLSRCEEAIIESKNPKLMYYFIGYVSGTNIPNMLENLLATNNIKYINLAFDHLNELDAYTLYVPFSVYGFEVNTFYPECLNQFCTQNVMGLQEKVIESKNPYFINELAENIDGVDLRLLQNEVLETGDILHIYEYMCSVSNAELELIQDTVINSGMAKYMFYFLKYVEGANEEILRVAINTTGNEKYIAKMNTI